MTSLMDKFKKGNSSSTTKEPQVKPVTKKQSEVVSPAKPIKKSAKQKGTGEFTKSYKILVKPLVSEKGAIQQANSKYFFAVTLDSNKVEIKKAIESVYGVNVVSVNIINQRGKAVRFGRHSGFRKSWKKAIVTLRAGERITTVEGV